MTSLFHLTAEKLSQVCGVQTDDPAMTFTGLAVTSSGFSSTVPWKNNNKLEKRKTCCSIILLWLSCGNDNPQNKPNENYKIYIINSNANLKKFNLMLVAITGNS